jgi:hypothetical protein
MFDFSTVFSPYLEGCNQQDDLPQMLQVQLTVKHPDIGEEVLECGSQRHMQKQ